jgi:hypothetical protein
VRAGWGGGGGGNYTARVSFMGRLGLCWFILGRLAFPFFPHFFCEAIPHYFKVLAQIWGYFDFLVYFISFFHFVEFFNILQI